MHVPVLTIIVLLPLLAMLCVMATSASRPQQARTISAVFMGVDMLLSIYMYWRFYALDPAQQAGFNFIDQQAWFPELGITFKLGLDGGWWGTRLKPEAYNLVASTGAADKRASVLWTNGQTVAMSNLTDFTNGIGYLKFANITSTGGPPLE